MPKAMAFDPFHELPAPHGPLSEDGGPPREGNGDGACDGDVYVFDDERIVLAVNVALATRRPLLVFGPPGSGKSTLAPNVARHLARVCHTEVITARTEPEDLLWRFDALKRLNDAQIREVAPTIGAYCTQGVLWKAFDPYRTVPGTPEAPADEPPAYGRHTGPAPQSVVLIDEIDKADPDLPNSLLVPLDTLRFTGPDGEEVRARPGAEPLVIITSNNERELPAPFVRRCILLSLEAPDKRHLLKVARGHLGTGYDESMAEQVAEHLLKIANESEAAAGPSTAEFLDTLKACHELGVTPGSHTWDLVMEVALSKGRGSARPHG
ncbi:AAA family ATPase [Embleya sp. NBC_00896]|uniref:AAA family ATPase n=1 Tax=Embleya sp. NBC_00896 TaxID=2975961 RepID=UPI003862EC99|nr:MoxR family ATPase [Embleya sp. NBC_00896]